MLFEVRDKNKNKSNEMIICFEMVPFVQVAVNLDYIGMTRKSFKVIMKNLHAFMLAAIFLMLA